MYFHTDDPAEIAVLAGVVLAAKDCNKRLRINVDANGDLTWKLGEGVWSAPVRSTADPYRSGEETIADRAAREVREGRIRQAFTTERIWLKTED